MSLYTMFLTSLALGVMHGFDPDHVMIVTNFISQNPEPKKALRFGLNFGLGHSAAVLAFSIIALSLKVAIGEHLAAVLESAAGVVLVLLGVWVITSALKHRREMRKHTSSHGHEHSHGRLGHRHPHGHAFHHEHIHGDMAKNKGVALIGVITGVAGTASVMLFGPVLSAPNLVWAAMFIAVYGLGVIFSMSVYGFLASRFYLAAQRSQSISHTVVMITGAASIVLGVLWSAGVL